MVRNGWIYTSYRGKEHFTPFVFGAGIYPIRNIFMTFQYVQPTEEQKAQMQLFRDKFEVLYKEIKELPASRGLSLTLTKLEEATFWLNKSITKND